METRSGIQPDGSSHPGPGLLHPHLVPDKNGVQTRHMSKRIRLRHGNHTSRGNEVIFIDPHKGTHDDEKYRLCVTEYIYSPFLPLVLLLWETCETVIVPFHSTSMTLLALFLIYLFYDCFAQGQLVSAFCVIFIHVRCDEKGGSLKLSLLSPSC